MERFWHDFRGFVNVGSVQGGDDGVIVDLRAVEVIVGVVLAVSTCHLLPSFLAGMADFGAVGGAVALAATFAELG